MSLVPPSLDIANQYSISDLKTRFVVATEIREILDTLRDADASRALPFIIPPLVELLQSGEVSFRKESLEFQFRSVVLSILTRLPTSEHAKPHVQSIYNCLLYVIRQDNEENGVSACKHIVELVRAYRMLTEENLRDFTSLFKDVFANMKPMTEQLLSEGSVELDSAVSLPSIKSFKVTAELGLVMAITFILHVWVDEGHEDSDGEAAEGPDGDGLFAKLQCGSFCRYDPDASHDVSHRCCFPCTYVQ